ncbi:MAG: ThiF family adenylyltransferase [Chitinophagales bacterium]
MIFSKESSYKIENNVILKNNEEIGIIKPTIFHEIHSDKIDIYGSNEIISLASNLDDDEKIIYLRMSGSILLGNKEEVHGANQLLADPVLSRTYSYLSEVAENLSELINFYNLISEARVMLIGCGGIGSLTALNLAGLGVKKLVLIEGDRIEESNLNRQFLFSRRDIGKYKIDVLKEFILNRFNCELNCIKKRINFEEINSIVKNIDLLIITADEPDGIEFRLHKTAFEKGIPSISGGYANNLSKVFSNLGSKIEDTILSAKVERFPFSIMPSFGPTNTELAGLISSLATQYLIKKLNAKEEINICWENNKFPRNFFN